MNLISQKVTIQGSITAENGEKTQIIHLWTSDGDAVTTYMFREQKRGKLQRTEKENVTSAEELH